MLKASVGLPRLLWLYALLLHTPLDLHTESNVHLLAPSNLFVNTLINQDKKVAFIRVDEYGALARYSEFMKTCHNMNIKVQTTGGYASSISGKSEIPDKTLANNTRALIMNSSHKK